MSDEGEHVHTDWCVYTYPDCSWPDEPTCPTCDAPRRRSPQLCSDAFHLAVPATQEDQK